jgi:hypothetical protein
MADEMKQAWSAVGDRVAALGEAMKHRTSTASDAATATPETDADAKGDSGTVRDALDTVLAAVKELGEKASTLVKDPEVRSHTKDVAQSLTDALSATVDQIGDEVGSLVKKAKGGGGGAPPDPPGPPPR